MIDPRWVNGEGHEYRITRISAPQYFIERNDGQVISESDGSTKLFYADNLAAAYLDRIFTRREHGSMSGRTVREASLTPDGPIRIEFTEGPAILIQGSNLAITEEVENG